MFVQTQCTFESDTENCDVEGYGNHAASDKAIKTDYSLPCAKDDDIKLVMVKGKVIKTDY